MKRSYEQVPDPLQVYYALTGEEEVGVEWLDLDQIILSDDTQPRAEINWEKVAEYAERMDAGDEFPAVVVFHEAGSGRYWLADGFHRAHATRRREKPENRRRIRARVIAGTLRDAILFSVSANGTHGMPRTNEDKRRAVLRLLADPEWSQWSDREIARRCKVNKDTVRKYRDELSGEIRQIETQDDREPSAVIPQMETRKVQRGGTVYEQRVSSEKRSRAAQRRARSSSSRRSPQYVYDPDVSQVPQDEAKTERAGLERPVPSSDHWAAPAGQEIRQLHTAHIETPQEVDVLNNYLREVIISILSRHGGELIVKVFWKPPREED